MERARFLPFVISLMFRGTHSVCGPLMVPCGRDDTVTMLLFFANRR